MAAILRLAGLGWRELVRSRPGFGLVLKETDMQRFRVYGAPPKT